ncbi:GAF and ANTAR domain-containing protein [Nakamurella endophytica]|uniref:ANTAR domain-containing protein n=1 Tax=Nakamurella endophytica TaxID=1748367 RepID=A0A917T658_9ACTN|nr:GAF and ANTAR domain-containing protein [Nakamurella endophytica]GGM11948.1 hypothetical protein GCM10011594_34750 [Nakamurella endophytica]
MTDDIRHLAPDGRDDLAATQSVVLRRLAAGLALGADSAELCSGLVEDLRLPLGVDMVLQYTRRPGSDRLVLGAAAGLAASAAGRLRAWPLDRSTVSGAVATSGQPQWFDDVQRIPDPQLAVAKGLGLTAYLSVPLLHAGLTVGTVSFGSRTRLSFVLDERILLRAAADLLAVTVAATSAAPSGCADLEQQVVQLERAMDGRTAIGRAVGMLMLAMPADRDTAWATLRYLSSVTNRKVRDLAEQLEVHFADGATLPADVDAHVRTAVTRPPRPRHPRA